MAEFVVAAVIASAVIGLLLWQRQKQQRLRQARVIEAPIAQRGTIVSAVFVVLAVLFAVFALMMASLEEWTKALVFVALSSAVGAAFWFTKKPLGVLRIDTDAATLVFTYRGSSAQIDLKQPFELTERLRTPSILVGGLGGDSYVLVVVGQGDTRFTFCHPWTPAELGSTTSEQTTDSLPDTRLDWRGALVLERLRTFSLAHRTAPVSG